MAGDGTSPMYRTSLERQRSHMEKHWAAIGAERDRLEPIITYLLPVYARADAEAMSFQRARARAVLAVHGLSASAVSIAIAQFLFLPAWPAVIWLEVAAMLSALVLLIANRRLDWHSRWIGARHVAEQARTMMFLAALPGGLEDQASRPATLLARAKTSTRELHESLRAVLDQKQLATCAIDDASAARRFLLDGWIRDQLLFHTRNSARKAQLAARLHHVVLAIFAFTLITAMLHALHIGGSHGDEPLTFWSVINLITLFLTIALPAWAAALHGISNLLDWESSSHRSARIVKELESSIAAVEQAKSFDELRKAAHAAEWALAYENHEWLASVSSRQLPSAPA